MKVRTLVWFSMGAALLLLGLSTVRGDGEAKTSPFSAWNGRWQGIFKVYKPDGTLNTRLNVTQTYTEGKDGIQRAEFVEVDSRGRKITATAKNWVEKGVLWCEVKKSDGSVSRHKGRVLGEGALCWSYQDKEKTESFFEKVVEQGGKTYYEIHGFGVYGGKKRDCYYFEGRYQKTALDKDR